MSSIRDEADFGRETIRLLEDYEHAGDQWLIDHIRILKAEYDHVKDDLFKAEKELGELGL